MPRYYRFFAIAACLLTGFAPAFAVSTGGCAEHQISAIEVRTNSDVQAFVRCAAEYLAEHGTAEARRAFNEDRRWNNGPIYVFVDGIARSAEESLVHVYPPDPSREGDVWGSPIDSFGTDYYTELHRMLSIVDSGWIYYSILNPATGMDELKGSFVVEVDWQGRRAALGAGLYAPDLPGTCNPDEVNATLLASSPSPDRLQAFVRCAAMLVEEKGYSARNEIEGNPRWSSGPSYVFVMDMEGNQVLTGNGVRVNGRPLHEWGGKSTPTDQFGGRDMVAVGSAFGEALIYYQGRNPMTGAHQPKVGLLKRVVAHGVPLIVGSGYHLGTGPASPVTSCEDNLIAASAIRTRRDIQAFVRCAAEYASEHGTEEARRAFHEDRRWKHGPYYVFVDVIAEPHDQPLSHIAVFPPNPAWEGTSQTLIDSFGTDYFDELHRVMTFGGSGWLHYAFTNFVSGRSEPKSSYVVEIDWDGQRAVVGAGIYLRDLPGTCASSEVNASALEADPGDERLQELVRCAAGEMESQGYFATATLATAPRWNSGSTYVFGVDLHGNALFNGDLETGASELTPVATMPFGGRDVVSVGEGFGEVFLYYETRNPLTSVPSRKVALVKRVVIQGIPALIGAGYYPKARPGTVPPTGGSGGGGGPRDGASRIADRAETATLLYWQAPTILNPYLSNGTKDAEAASIVIEPLAEYNPNGELVAVLAAGIPTVDNGEVSKDHTQITWRLRDDVVWSDGTPLTAGDVVFTWQYCTAPGSGCTAASRFENVASIEAVDEKTVTINFAEPTAFPYVPFVSRASPVLQASQFAACLGSAVPECSAANLQPVGTGPYSVAEFGAEGTIHYRFNPLFRNIESGQPYFSDVILKGGGTAADAARSVLELGEADFAWNLQVEPDLLAEMSAAGRGTLVSSFALTVERLVLNQTNSDPSLGDRRSQFADGTNPHPFLSDPVVGRALSLAIDRDTLARTGYGELAGRPTCNIWPAPPVQASPDKSECPAQNITLARTILDDAGIVDSDGDGVRERNGVPLKYSLPDRDKFSPPGGSGAHQELVGPVGHRDRTQGHQACGVLRQRRD